MSSAKQVSSNGFINSAAERLAEYLGRTQPLKPGQIIPLTPDASTRNYFRFPWKKGTADAALSPQPIDAGNHPLACILPLLFQEANPAAATCTDSGGQGSIVHANRRA